MKFPSFDRTPPIGEFGVPDPPKGLPIIWHIHAERNPDAPFKFDLPGIGSLWIYGWFVPAAFFEKNQRTIILIYNEQRISTSKDELLPENAFELSGFVSCILRNLKRSRRAKEMEDLVKRKVSIRINTIFNDWLGQIYEVDFNKVLLPILNDSPRLRNLFAENQGSRYIQLMYQYLKFPTNEGEKTAHELKLGFNAVDRSILQITRSVAPHHFLIKSNKRIVDLREERDQFFFGKVFKNKNLKSESDYIKLKLVEEDLLEYEMREDVLNAVQHKLKEWFERGLNKSPFHQQVRVGILSSKYSGNMPAALIPSKSPDITEKLGYGWFKNATLLINPQSNLAKRIEKLINMSKKEKLYKSIPVAVYNTALLFTLGTFIERVEENHWKHINQILKQFNQDRSNNNLTKEIVEQIDKVNSRTGPLIDMLQIPDLWQKMEDLTEENQTYRTMLGLNTQYNQDDQEKN